MGVYLYMSCFRLASVCLTMLLLAFLGGCCSVPQEARPDWSLLNRKCFGESGYCVQSELAAAVSLASPLSRGDAIKASRLICNLLLDSDICDYVISSCGLDLNKQWVVVFERSSPVSGKIEIVIDQSGFIDKIAVDRAAGSPRTRMYAELVSMNRHLVKDYKGSDEIVAALCAREIAGLLSRSICAWEVVSVKYDNDAEEWVVSAYLNGGIGAKLVLAEDFQIRQYHSAVISQ